MYFVNEISFPTHWTPELIEMIQENIASYNNYQDYKQRMIMSFNTHVEFDEWKITKKNHDPCSDYQGRRKY